MMTLAEKIATVSKLERIDSSIESCIKILEQELSKRVDEAPGWGEYALLLLSDVVMLKEEFNIMKAKKVTSYEVKNNNKCDYISWLIWKCFRVFPTYLIGIKRTKPYGF